MIVATLLALALSYTSETGLTHDTIRPLIDTLSASPREYTLVADRNGRLVIDNKTNTYRPEIS